MSALETEMMYSALGKVNLVMGTVLQVSKRNMNLSELCFVKDMSYARIDVTKAMKFHQVAAQLQHQVPPHKGRKPPPQKRKKSPPQRRTKHQLNQPQVKRKPL